MSALAILALVFLGLLIIALCWKTISWWLAKPDSYSGQTIDDVQRFIHSLRLTVGDDGMLMINHEGSDRFIQFVKYSRDNQAYLHFALPETAWSRKAFPKIQDICRDRGYECRINPVEGPIIKNFLEIELPFSNEDAEMVVFDFSKEVFSSFGLTLQDRFSVRFSGDPNYDYARELVSVALKEESENSLRRKALEWSAKTLEKPDQGSN